MNDIYRTVTNDGFSALSTPKQYAPIHCPTQIQTRNLTSYGDPNKHMRKVPYKHVTSHPPHDFFISLHKKYYDMQRWNSIYVKGDYYETGITDQFHVILRPDTYVGTELGDGVASEQKKLEPGLVLDIGMNIGWYTLWARALGHSVVAFEPTRIMHTRICESLQLNHWDVENISPHNLAKVQIFPFGLGEVEEVRNLTMGNNPGGSSFDEWRLAPKYRRSVEVKVVTLDEVARQEGWLADDYPLQIHLMKLDVEGHEYHVVRGGMALLNSRKIQNIIMENSIKNQTIVMDLFKTMYDAGYRIQMLSSVNGDAYHPEWVPGIRSAVETYATSGRVETEEDERVFQFFSAGSANNLWWKLQS